MAFHEDESRFPVGHAAENFAVLRHIALNLLRHERSLKVGIQGRTSALRLGPRLPAQSAGLLKCDCPAVRPADR
jgi:hypothetical protein